MANRCFTKSSQYIESNRRAAAEEVLHWDNNVIISLHVQLGAPTESEMHLDSESEINGKSYIYQATQTFAIYVQLILAHRS